VVVVDYWSRPSIDYSSHLMSSSGLREIIILVCLSKGKEACLCPALQSASEGAEGQRHRQEAGGLVHDVDTVVATIHYNRKT
jgi:hypothetical protein